MLDRLLAIEDHYRELESLLGDPDVLAVSRKVRGNKVTVYANLQAEPSKTIKSLRSKDNPDGILPAWGWKIITR